MGSLPQEGNSQEIGRRAVKALHAQMPDLWLSTDLSGDADFGLDFLIQVKNLSSQVFSAFYLQLKGTESPDYVSEGNYISQVFNTSSLNYYRNQAQSVMVAVVDLTSAEKAKDCKIFYKWLDSDFLDTIGEQLRTQETFTVRVPTQDIIDEDLDILSYCMQRIAGERAFTKLKKAVAPHSEDILHHIDLMAEAVNQRPILLDLIKDESDTPWFESSDSHVAGKLKSIFDSLSKNQIEYAQKKIEELKSEKELSDHESAELLYLEGMLNSLIGFEQKALALFAEAQEQLESPRYLKGYIESLFRVGNDPISEIEKALPKLNKSNFKDAAFMAKCLAFIGKESEAVDVLTEHPESKTTIPLLVVYTLTKNDEQFEKVVKESSTESFTPIQHQLFETILGRYYFYRGIGYYSGKNNADDELPHTGRPDYDYDLLSRSLSHVKTAMTYARVCGFQYDTYLLVDVATAVFGYFGREQEVIEFIRELLPGRLGVDLLVDAQSRLLFNARDFSGVVKLFKSKQGDLDAGQAVMMVLAYSYQDLRVEVVATVDEYSASILKSKPKNYLAAFCVAAQCAREMLDTNREAQYLEVLRAESAGDVYLAIYEFVRDCRANPRRANDFKARMYERYQKLGCPYEIASQLVRYLDPSSPGEADKVGELCEKIEENRRLDSNEQILYANSLLVRKCWADLIAYCDSQEKSNGKSHAWTVMKASALDGIGRTSDAMDLLDDIVGNDLGSLNKAAKFINLSLSLGFYEKAERKLETLVANSDESRRYELLRIMVIVYSSNQNRREKLINALVQLGELADIENEENEGVYLSLFVMATLRGVEGLEDSIVRDFYARVTAFCKKYPKSKYFMKFEGEGDGLLDRMQALSGVTESDRAKWERNRHLIRRNRLPAPYVLAPSLIGEGDDVFSFWVKGEYLGQIYPEYAISHSKVYRLPPEAREISVNDQILLDETSLLVMSRLGILNKVLGTIPNPIVCKDTFQKFSKASHPLFGSQYSEVALDVVSVLQEYIEKIELLEGFAGEYTYLSQLDSLLSLLQNPVICSDDQFLLILLGSLRSKTKAINTLSVIDYLAFKGVIDFYEKIELIEKMCQLGVRDIELGDEHVNASLIFHLSKLDGASLSETGFDHIFRALYIRSSPTSIEKIASLFYGVLNCTDCKADIAAMDELLEIWMVNKLASTDLDLLSAIADWFICCCYKVVHVVENDLLDIGLGEQKLWYLAQKLAFRKSLSIDQLMEAVSWRIFHRVTDVRDASDLCDKTASAFVSGSNDRSRFMSIYTNVSIEFQLRFGPR